MTEEPFGTPVATDLDSRWIPNVERHVLGVRLLIDKLERAVASLPHVGPDGSSECPSAEALYAQKEALEQQLFGEVMRLRAHLDAVEEELQRCQYELNVISGDKPQLTFGEAIDHYSQAEQELRGKCITLARERSMLHDVISHAVTALAVSQSKKYPGRKPEETPFDPGAPAPIAPPGTPAAFRAPYAGSAYRPEPRSAPSPGIGNLVRLGPLGGGES